MVTYIYFVKCPNCEDEHFDFFDEAKAFAMGCMSQKPIITQTEVCRNDFGECTDSHDLGTVWSWEDAMKDTEGGYTEAEPAKSIFTKDDLKLMADGKDPEFDDDDFYFNNGLVESAMTRFSFNNNADREECFKLCREIGIITGEDLRKFMDENDADDSNLLDKLREYRDELGDDFKIEECQRKPIPEGMTIEQLVETMQENEDTVECAGCEELHSKEDCVHKEDIGWLCPDCEDRIVKCTWCDELYDKSECRYEVDLGWLCSRCEAGIKSRGETLTFREGNYWDFLDEDVENGEEIPYEEKYHTSENRPNGINDDYTIYCGSDKKEGIVDKSSVVEFLGEIITDKDVKELSKGRWQTYDEIEAYDEANYWTDYKKDPKRLSKLEPAIDTLIWDNFDELCSRYEEEIDIHFEDRCLVLNDEDDDDGFWDYVDHKTHEWQDAKIEAEFPDYFG